MVRAQRARLFFLGGGGGKGRHLGAEDPRELDGHVAQAADAHNAYPRRGVDAMGAQRIVDRDAAAKQRRGVLAGEGLGDRNHEAGIGADAIRIAAMPMHAGAFRRGAKVFHAAGAPLALAAGVRLPAQSHALAHRERSNPVAHSRHRADNLMAGNERILADAPVVRDQVNIAMADAAVGDGNLNLLRAQLPWVIAKRQQFCSRRVCCKSLNLSHGRSDFLTRGGKEADKPKTGAGPQIGRCTSTSS